MKNNNFPRCIYLDTNILRRIPLEDPTTSFLELKKWAEESNTPVVIPQTVWMEWVHDFDENIKKKFPQTKSNLKDLKSLIQFQYPKFELPRDYFDRLLKSLRKKIKNLHISIADTPKNVSIGELVIMAAFKIRPFEEKGEKGFRDTIILYTILEDMKKRAIKDSIFVTDDGVFTHKDVLDIVEKYNARIEIVSSLEAASLHIKEVLDEKIRTFIELEKKKLFDFVITKQSEIFAFIKDRAKLTEDFITKGGFLSSKQDIFGEIERVLEFEPRMIESVFEFPSRDEKQKQKDSQSVLISVSTYLKVEYLPLLLFNRPVVKVQDLGKFKEIVRSATPKYYGNSTEIELTRSLSVSASVLTTDGKYSNLKIERVSTF